jgi:hypothetical protein
MSAVETPLKVVIAADTAMSRDVVRFFLQASGDIEVIGQAASAGDASWMAKKYAADAVVIHAGIAFDATQDAVRHVRSAAPAARIVVVTPEGGGVPLPLSSRGADSYLEEGVGLAELAFVLISLCRSPDIAIDVQPAFDRRPQPDPVVVVPQPEPELVLAGASAAATQSPNATRISAAPEMASGSATPLTWRGRGGLVPLLAAAAAFVMVVGLTIYRTQVENLLAPRGTAYFAGVHVGPQSSVLLLASEERLEDLVHSLHGARIVNAPAIARDLVERRSQIVEAGGDVTALDREIETTLRPIIATSPPGIAVAVLTVLAPVAGWANADLDALLLGGAPPTPAVEGGHAQTPSRTPGASSTGAGDGVTSPSDPGSTSGTAAGEGAGEPAGTEGSTHDGGHGGGSDGEGGGDGGDGGGSGGGDGDGDGGGGGGGGGGTGQDGDGEGDGDQDGDGDQGGGGPGDDQGEDDQGEDGGDGAGEGDCDHPGNGGGHGYGHCDEHGGGNDDHVDGEDLNPGEANGRQAHLLTGPILLLGLKRRRR